MTRGDLPERFLREIWRRQLFTASELSTPDGRSVSILDPGVPNDDAGPDFSGARVRIGNITFVGDVEFHRNASEWRRHGHQHDPRYNRVILHVVMADDDVGRPAETATRRSLPVLVLHPFLDPESRVHLLEQLDDTPSAALPGLRCRDMNAAVPAPTIEGLLVHHGEARIELKIRRHEERLKELVDAERLSVREPYPRYYGDPNDIPHPVRHYRRADFARRQLWDQLLYEGIMEALGYSKNASPFAALARTVPLSLLRRYGLADTDTMTALLLGAAGLLPSTRRIDDPESRRYLLSLRRRWKEVRGAVQGPVLQEADWRFFRLRPGNFPTARLAAFCSLLPRLFDEASFGRIIHMVKGRSGDGRMILAGLAGLFDGEPGEFWLRHYRFGRGSRRHGAGLGAERRGDILTNAVLPIVLLYARLFGDVQARAGARSALAALPAPTGNAVQRLLDRQLFRGRVTIDSALLHQGALHLYKFWCSAERCMECRIGRVAVAGPG